VVDGQRLQLPLPQWRLKSLDEPDPQGPDLGFVQPDADDDIPASPTMVLRVGNTAVPTFALALYARSRDAGLSGTTSGA